MIYLSPLNPLRFYVLSAKPDEPTYNFPSTPTVGSFFPYLRKQEYVQKFAPIDDIFIQLITSLGTTWDFNIYLCNENGRIINTTSPTKRSHTTENLRWQTWQIPLSSYIPLSSGKRQGKFIIVLRDNQTPRMHYASNLFCVNAENSKLPLIHYKNSRNRGDIYYGSGSTQHIDIFSLRIEGGFLEKNYNPKINATVYMGGDLKYNVLNSLTYYTRTFTAGNAFGIDDDFHFTVANAFATDTLFIDKRGFSMFEGAIWSPKEIEHYPLRTWNIEVAPNGLMLDRDNILSDALFHQGWMHPNNYLYNNSLLFRIGN